MTSDCRISVHSTAHTCSDAAEPTSLSPSWLRAPLPLPQQTPAARCNCRRNILQRLVFLEAPIKIYSLCIAISRSLSLSLSLSLSFLLMPCLGSLSLSLYIYIHTRQGQALHIGSSLLAQTRKALATSCQTEEPRQRESDREHAHAYRSKWPSSDPAILPRRLCRRGISMPAAATAICEHIFVCMHECRCKTYIHIPGLVLLFEGRFGHFQRLRDTLSFLEALKLQVQFRKARDLPESSHM